ncbi:methylamine utilization protein MauE [Stackebrandtia endophytica]|uniref:Methylamine utilization protein MauE n=1 Tax=Stackebrandtia endophytica TaxID=1496996 RepID=A0A543B0W7_9ACTN|nr:MauE/DoxX family redox-associated membrane protein [Stackebrandtia endophytica]TQL78472.1 methylamine utilization protein MauE [Stackebrandtia endophytica]
MADFLGMWATIIAVGAAAIGVIVHVRSPRELPDALAAHAVLPTALVRPVATMVAIAEVGLAVTVVMASILGSNPVAVVALVALAVLFAGYAGYLHRVASTGRSVPCGCSLSREPVTGWTVVRAASFALAAAIGAAATPIATLPGDPASWTIVVPAAAATLILLWTLPAAMRQFDPRGARWTS